MASTIKKIAVLTVAATLLTSCGSGQTAATRAIKQVTDGVEAQSNEVRLRNIKIVKNNLSEGILVGTLVNWSDTSDALVGISIDAVPAQLSAPLFELVKNKPITFVGESANADAFALITKNAGQRLPITFTFTTASPITVDALVVQQEGIYEVLQRVIQTQTPVVTEEVKP
jgi:copper(I)-binding protein